MRNLRPFAPARGCGMVRIDEFFAAMGLPNVAPQPPGRHYFSEGEGDGDSIPGDKSGDSDAKPGDSPQQQPPGGEDSPKDDGKGERTFTKAEFDEVVGQRQAVKEQLRTMSGEMATLREQLAAMPSADELEVFQDWKADTNAQARDKAIKDGDVDEIERAVREPLQAQVEAKDKRIDVLETQLTRTLCDNALMGAAVKANAVDPNDVVGLLRSRVRMVATDTGEFTPNYLSPDRQTPQYDGKGDRVVDVETFVNLFLAGKPHLVKSDRASGSGARQQGGGTGNAGKVTSMEQLAALPPEQQKEAIARMTPEERKALGGPPGGPLQGIP